MKLVFIDETSDAKERDYFGICIAVVDSVFYSNIKTEFQKILIDAGWDEDTEFKGSFLFSAKKGCLNIPVDTRVEIASKLLELNTAKSNSRIKFYYFSNKTNDHKADYLEYLPLLLEKAIGKAQKKSGKDIIAIHCDNRNDIDSLEVDTIIKDTINKKGYVLFEQVVQSKSNFDTVGILYADLVAYLVARIQVISNDNELFESLTPEELNTNGKFRKLESSRTLIDKIKNLDVFTLKG